MNTLEQRIEELNKRIEFLNSLISKEDSTDMRRAILTQIEQLKAQIVVYEQIIKKEQTEEPETTHTAEKLAVKLNLGKYPADYYKFIVDQYQPNRKMQTIKLFEALTNKDKETFLNQFLGVHNDNIKMLICAHLIKKAY